MNRLAKYLKTAYPISRFDLFNYAILCGFGVLTYWVFFAPHTLHGKFAVISLASLGLSLLLREIAEQAPANTPE